MLLNYNNTVNGLDLTYNGEVIQGSGLLSHETESGSLLSWCVGPLDHLQTGWVEYTPSRLVPTAREDQVGWIIADQGWGSIGAMSTADQDALGLVLNEAWLEDTSNELDLTTGTSIITGEQAATASAWIEASQGMSYDGVNITILVDDLGQSQATWDTDAAISVPSTVALLVAGAVAWILLKKKPKQLTVEEN